MHVSAPAADHVPAGHAEQVPEFTALVAGEAVPAAQSVQDVELARDHFPVPHATGATLFEAQLEPAEHGLHAVLDVAPRAME